jgi:hypothetical protein
MSLAAGLALLVAAPALAHDVTPGDATAAAKDQAATPTETKSVEGKKDEKVPESMAYLTGGTTESKRKFPLGGIVLLEQELGSGTFVADQYARNPFYALWVSIRPRWYITNKLFLEARADLNWEATTSYATGTTHPRQVMPGDMSFTLRYQDVYKIPVLGIGITPAIRMSAPTSYESRYRGLYTSLAASIDLTRVFGQHFFIDYGFRISKNFNKYPVATVTGPVAVVRERGNEDLGNGIVATNDLNVSFSVTDSLLLSGMINDQWSVSLLFAIANSWTYFDAPKDALAADAAKGGPGQRDRTYGMIDVTYQPWEHMGFSMGLYSIQPAKTADNKSFRFPFFDFRSEPNNFTYLYLDVFASY